MADSNPGGSSSPSQRRKSFVEMLNPRSYGNTSSLSTSPSNAVPAAPAASSVPTTTPRKSSMSIALGLSGSGGQESPFNAFARQRRASISTTSTSGTPEFRNSFDDNAVIEDDDKVPAMNAPPSPSFARRLSFGAQALRDVRQTGTSPTNNAGRRPSSSLFTLSEDSDHRNTTQVARSPGTAKTAGEGFNWSDAMRDKNKRASISTSNPFTATHNRSKSFNTANLQPPKEIQSSPTAQPQAPAAFKTKKPDHLGERMLRGDFMMD